ncbi:MAG TPA: DUF1015 domain-containing protein, partial [Candidatus Goldiibacteriota bacterium]|nr:DUF1015 domain-containing protein [Candidatus Goldiibacteriota bacterium]
MADVKPFRAVRYNTSKVDLKKVIMPPYDIIRDVNEYYQRDPYNIVRIDKAREENREAPGIDKYARSGLAVRRWLEEGILLRDEKPLFYVYEQEYFMPSGEKKSMISFYASVKLEEFEKKIVLPHERTHSGPKADRLMLMRATNANTSPILSLYFDPEKNVHEILEKYRTSCAPLMQCVNDDGLRHSLWAISDPAEQEKIGFYMKSCQLFIADGHHRYETALNYRDEMRAKENSSGERPYDRIMMVLISMEHAGTSILPTHRLMKKFRRLDFAEDTAVKS